ncbi:MAG: adenylate/guanylate cyclase domain-containing protein [Pseudomonadota bacterium]
MLTWLKRLRDTGITDEMPALDIKHVRITNIAALMAAVMTLPWVPVNLILADWTLALNLTIGGFILLGVFYLNRVGKHLSAAVVLMINGQLQISFSVWVYGMPSDVWVYLVLLVLFPYFIFFARHRWVAHFFAATTTLLIVFFLLFAELFPPQVVLMPQNIQVAINNSVTVIGVAIMAAASRLLIDNSEQALQHETARADALLLNVLPPQIADRLKHAPDQSIADRHEEISVLFADIVGFTPLSARLSAGATVEILNQIFTAFDEICDRNGVEKIRTIGDGYMAVAGAPVHRDDHAAAMVKVAVEMRDYMNSVTLDEPLQVRIGINSGEAVAGIVGTSRFHYDLWGDAVNVAARMESLGVPGKIQIARATWDKIKDTFECESRGLIAVKGKEDMETWFVLYSA